MVKLHKPATPPDHKSTLLGICLSQQRSSANLLVQDLGELNDVPGRSLLLTACLLLLSSIAPAQFETRASAVVPAAVNSVAVGDFNGDGRLDVAAVDYIPNPGVTILLGNGDGTFTGSLTYPAGTQPYYVATQSLRNNGILDLVVEDTLTEDVYVLLGNGDGTFQPAVPYATYGYPHSNVVIGDFTGDGIPDIAVVSDVISGCSCLSVLPGNGDGSFQAAIVTDIPYGIAGQAIAAGYFNADTKLDLVIVGFFGGSAGADILLGNGDGTFTPRAFHATDQEPESVTVADLRGNGKTDVVVGNFIGSTISVLLGNGDGTFEPPVRYAVPFPSWIVADDFDSDGKLDLAVGLSDLPAGVSVLKGNGDGTFQPGVFYSAGNEISFIATGDFNGDHIPDIVLADFIDDAVVTLLNTGTVSFSPTTPITLPTVLLGATSPSRSSALTNNGTSPLTITSVKSSGPPFDAKTTCRGTLAPGASCGITAKFTATAEGVTAGTVTIYDSASSKPQVVEMLGTGTGVKLTPVKLTFPAVKVGTQSQPETIQLTNIGSTPLDFTRTIYIGGLNYTEFFESDNCGMQIGAGASCTISITFKPKNVGTRTANVTINDDGGGSPQTAQLSGTGT